ncbi:hypothetical protein DTO271G3_651 [Paecilomyces variotii]|nr:hypothetical protein DTO271G3_651 [Paecilomyces variotii]
MWIAEKILQAVFTVKTKEMGSTDLDNPLWCPWGERLRHITWGWYMITMSTGGLALLLHNTPHQFKGLSTIGVIVFIFDLALFVTISIGLTYRFACTPSSFKRSLTHPTESLFFGTFWLTLATIISNIQVYGVPSSGPWLVVAVRVLFWIYTALTYLVAVLQYWHLFSGRTVTLQSFTTAWIVPVFPVMLTGTIASLVAQDQPSAQAIPIIVAGTAFQGLGFIVALLMYANYIGRLMTGGFPDPDTRPGMFIAVGPPAFTGLALSGMAKVAISKFPVHYVTGTSNVPTAEVLRIISVFIAVFLWAVSFWFFSISVLSILTCLHDLTFHLTWWSFIFPNTGFVLATIEIGNELGSNAIAVTCSVLTVLIVAMYLLVGISHIRAVYRGEILWPGKDEDKAE